MEINVQHQANLGSVTITELFSKAVYRKPTLIMLALMVFRQTTGINAVLFYLTDVFDKANTGYSSELQTIIISVVQVICLKLIFCVNATGICSCFVFFRSLEWWWPYYWLNDLVENLFCWCHPSCLAYQSIHWQFISTLKKMFVHKMILAARLELVKIC